MAPSFDEDGYWQDVPGLTRLKHLTSSAFDPAVHLSRLQSLTGLTTLRIAFLQPVQADLSGLTQIKARFLPSLPPHRSVSCMYALFAALRQYLEGLVMPRNCYFAQIKLIELTLVQWACVQQLSLFAGCLSTPRVWKTSLLN